MKLSSLKYIAVALMLGGTMTSCSDFLDRPNEDSYTDGNYYQNDTQTKMSVVSLYTLHGSISCVVVTIRFLRLCLETCIWNSNLTSPLP